MQVRFIAALAGVGLLTGCATFGRQAFAPLEVTVYDVRLAGIGVQGGRLDVHLSMYNPNGYRLDAGSVRYRVHLDTLQIAQGAIDERISIMKKDSTRLRIPVEFGLREVVAAGNALAARGSLPFRLEGEVRVLTPFGSVTREFEQRGTYDGVNVSLARR